MDGPATTTPAMGRWEWVLLVAAVLVQQGAFIPVLNELLGREAALDALGNPVELGASDPLNFAAMLASLLIVGILSLVRLRALVMVIKQNPLVVATTLLVIASAAWSFDPALSIRRAGTYSVGILLALYLTSRCSFDELVRLIAASTVLPAICSLIYAFVAPQFAYMQDIAVAGSLRGVYSHKNQLANVLAIGFLLQIYLVARTPRKKRHSLLAGLHVLLVVMARAKASALTLVLIVLSLGLYRLARINRQIGTLAILAGLLLVAVFALGAIDDPDGFFALLGRDATLTGRTDLWPKILPVIEQHPWLGWGYSAFWQPSNAVVQRIWYEVGWEPPHSHNGFLEVAIDLGITGLIAAIMLLVRFGINAARQVEHGLATWVYLCMIGYTLFNNVVEITILRSQEFAWFSFILFYLTCQAGAVRARDIGRAAPHSILARARPLPVVDHRKSGDLDSAPSTPSMNAPTAR